MLCVSWIHNLCIALYNIHSAALMKLLAQPIF